MVVLTASKWDIDDQEVSTEEGKMKAEEYGFKFYETSANH